LALAKAWFTRIMNELDGRVIPLNKASISRGIACSRHGYSIKARALLAKPFIPLAVSPQ